MYDKIELDRINSSTPAPPNTPASNTSEVIQEIPVKSISNKITFFSAEEFTAMKQTVDNSSVLITLQASIKDNASDFEDFLDASDDENSFKKG